MYFDQVIVNVNGALQYRLFLFGKAYEFCFVLIELKISGHPVIHGAKALNDIFHDDQG